jgi:hypothetical protein
VTEASERRKESTNEALDAAAYVDISFLPIGPRRRKAFKSEDWSTNPST